MRRATAAQRLEFLVLIALLLPFYLVLLPARGLAHAAGFAWPPALPFHPGAARHRMVL